MTTQSNTMESIFRLMRSLKCHLDQSLEEHQLGVVPMQVRVMMVIHKHPNCTANDVVKIAKRDKAQVTRLLNGLIEQGLIRKAPNPDDKRSQLLVFTEEGLTIKKQVLEQLDATNKKITEGLTDQEVKQFEHIAERIIHNLDQHC